MRTTIEIDDKLMRDVLRATGLKTKREAVEGGLRMLLRLKNQAKLRRLRGKLPWHGELEAGFRPSSNTSAMRIEPKTNWPRMHTDGHG
jgi:hypothetical protein